MPANRRHHYVPQAYQRLFAPKHGRTVGVFHIERCELFPHSPIARTGYKSGFYGPDDQAEKLLGNIENQAIPLLKRAMIEGSLPVADTLEQDALVAFLSVQHFRTIAAEKQHAEVAEKTMRGLLRRQLQLEGNAKGLADLDRVVIKRNNVIGELLALSLMARALLRGLKSVVIRNESDVAFISSDAPVVLHNRLYEGKSSHGVEGLGSRGLQLFLPLGPRASLMLVDELAYDVAADDSGEILILERRDAELLNALQWEAAHSLIFCSPSTVEADLLHMADRWSELRPTDRTLFRDEVVSDDGDEIRTMIGGGPTPSLVRLALSFVANRLPEPALLGDYELVPVRDPVLQARVCALAEALLHERNLARMKVRAQAGR